MYGISVISQTQILHKIQLLPVFLFLPTRVHREPEKIEHFKYLVNVPESTLNELDWNEGQELIVTIRHDSLILKPETQTGRREEETT
jgi:hypothetical protein